MPKNEPDKNQWYWIDTQAMSRLCDAQPNLLVELLSGLVDELRFLRASALLSACN